MLELEQRLQLQQEVIDEEHKRGGASMLQELERERKDRVAATSRADVLQQRVLQLQGACNEADARAASLAAKLLSATTLSSLHHSSPPPDASSAILHLLRSFLDSSVSAGAFNKTSSAAASIIISSLTYACDNTQRPNVQQLLNLLLSPASPLPTRRYAAVALCVQCALPHGRSELMGTSGGGGVAPLMKMLREEGAGANGWRDVQSLVVLMIGCLCTDAAGRELVVTCERDVHCLLKLMCDAGGDVFFTRHLAFAGANIAISEQGRALVQKSPLFLQQIVSLLQHSEDVMTVRYACGALRNLSVDVSGRMAIGAVNGAVRLLHALCSSDDAGTASMAGGALRNFSITGPAETAVAASASAAAADGTLRSDAAELPLPSASRGRAGASAAAAGSGPASRFSCFSIFSQP